jgi:membrane protease YdiL (CAAX protease family)
MVFMNSNAVPPNPGEKNLLIFTAWTSILLVSDLPDILVNLISGQIPVWLFWIKVGFLGLFLGACFTWKSIRPLRPYAFIMFIFYIALAISNWVRMSSWWVGLISPDETSFFIGSMRPYIRDTGVALIVVAALWIVKRRWSEFFLAKGQLDAPIEPVRWLGIGTGESWRTFGWIFAVVAAVGVAIPTMLDVRPIWDLLMRVVPMLPAVLLFSAVNAFNEEIFYRNTLLSTLPEVIGKNHTLLLNAAFFGLAHYLYGSPPGVVGVLMTGFLAWLMGKSMLETKGLFWAWFIHFLPDVVIFFSYAILWIKE